jgi:parallel beta-helix repeat protein
LTSFGLNDYIVTANSGIKRELNLYAKKYFMIKKAQNSSLKTIVSKTLSLGLLSGFTATVILSSCNSSLSSPMPEDKFSNPTNIYYVDSSLGSDSNPGSQSMPFATINKCHDSAVPGNKCLVASGVYSNLVTVTRPGITFECQSGNCETRRFTITADETTVRGFYITDTATSADGNGISVSANNCFLENNHIYYTTRSGIYLSNTSAYCIVRNNKLERNSQMGIEVHGHNHIVEGNEIWGTIQYHPKWINPPAWVDADGIRFFGSGHIFRRNYIHDISIENPQNKNPHIDAFQTWDSQVNEDDPAGSDCIFEQNKIMLESEKTAGFQLEGGTHNLVIRNNIISAFNGLLAYRNGQFPYTMPSDISVLNNLFIGNLTYSLDGNPSGLSMVDTTDAMIKNNIFYNIPGPSIYIENSSNLSAGRNLAYRIDGVTPQASDNYNHINDLWGVNPLFGADYRLRAGSPAIDSGYTLSVMNDFDGNFRPQGAGFDIGPFEYHP